MAGYTAADYPFLTTTEGSDLAIARVTRTGELDPGFGTGGIVKVDVSGTADLATSIALQPDGKILVAGVTNHTTNYTVAARWLIVRLNADGTLDTTFDGDGLLILDPPFGGADEVNDRPHDVLVRPDGRIWIAGGYGWNGCGRAAIARLTPSGALDTCFDTDGWYAVSSWPSAGSCSDSFNGMTFAPDGDLILAGGINPSAFGYAGIMRLTD